MNPIKIFSESPSSLSELNKALSLVDNVTAFFDLDLRVVSKDHRFTMKKIDSMEFPTERDERARIMLSEIVNIFVKTAVGSEICEIITFQECFSHYCLQIMDISWCWEIDFKSFVDCAQYAVKKISKHFLNSSEASPLKQILLITDTDERFGAMAIRAVRYIHQNIPVIIPYQTLCEIINHPYFDYTDGDDLFKNRLLNTTKKICDKISVKEKWSLYTDGSLVAIFPKVKSDTPILNLKTMLEISFEDVKKEAILRSLGKKYLYKKITKDDVIELLSTEDEKFVIWSGHGTIKGVHKAMGFMPTEVSAILNQAKNVRFWDLHSCYLLGHIEKIMCGISNINSIVKISGGLVAETNPPKESSDMTSAYLFLASKALEKGKHHQIARIFPLMDGFSPENHPQLVTKKIINPLTHDGIVENVSSFRKAPRLYIDQQTTIDPLHLSGETALIPGMLSNICYSFKEISTDLSFKDFISSAFGQYCQRTKLISIETLKCNDGTYEKVCYFTKNYQARMIFFNDNSWNILNTEWKNSDNPLRAHHDKFKIDLFTESAEAFFQNALKCLYQDAVDDESPIEPNISAYM